MIMDAAASLDPRTRARDVRVGLYRRRVCEAAERCFAAAGIDNTKMDDVARGGERA